MHTHRIWCGCIGRWVILVKLTSINIIYVLSKACLVPNCAYITMSIYHHVYLNLACQVLLGHDKFLKPAIKLRSPSQFRIVKSQADAVRAIWQHKKFEEPLVLR